VELLALSVAERHRIPPRVDFPRGAAMPDRTAKMDIIVSGFPKSGNTWVTRLVAELVGCPVMGFWGSDHTEIACEGFDRQSKFRCFKSHTSPEQLASDKSATDAKTIFVVRDPRDIAISGTGYFLIFRGKFIIRGKLLKELMRLVGRRNLQNLQRSKVIEPLLTSDPYRLDQMIRAVLRGARHISGPLALPWAKHTRSLIANEHFFVRYEDLLSQPEVECLRILNHLGLQRSPPSIREAIKNQSFEAKRKQFTEAGDQARAEFLRVGRSEQWTERLSSSQIRLFAESLPDELTNLGYPLSKAVA
jgi:hypothetical protein